MLASCNEQDRSTTDADMKIGVAETTPTTRCCNLVKAGLKYLNVFTIVQYLELHYIVNLL
jgi:hypothetical protein